MGSAAGHQHTLKLQHKCQQLHNHVQRQTFTYNITNTQLWERESARALQTIRTVIFTARRLRPALAYVLELRHLLRHIKFELVMFTDIWINPEMCYPDLGRGIYVIII